MSMQIPAPALRNMLLCAGLIAVAGIAYWPSVANLWGFWTNSNYGGSHGLLVGALSLWLLFRARHELAAAPVRPSPVAGVVLLLCTVAWFIFYRAGIQTLYVLMLPVLMGLAVSAAFGFRATRAVAFPLAFLYFGTSAWEIFTGPLQSLTAAMVGVLAPLFGIPAHMQGDIVLLPGIGSFAIERGCSGVNFLAAGLAIAALVGELEKASLARRSLLLAVMAVIAVVSNWVRVLVVIDAGYATNMRHALVTRGHLMFGWVLFTTVMVAFVWFSMRPGVQGPDTAGVADADSRLRAQMPAYLATLAVLVAMPVLVYLLISRLDSSDLPVAFNAPAGKAQWHGPVSTVAPAWQPEFIGPHSQWHVAYQDMSGHNVEMVAIGYSVQGQGRKLVSEKNSLLGAGSPEPVAEAKVTLDGVPYMELVAANADGRRSLVWSIYDIGGREFVTPVWSQLWYGMRSLAGAPYSVQFAFRTACEGSCDSARATLGSFLRTMGPEFFASVGRGSRSGPTSRQL